MIQRCAWLDDNPLMLRYHDQEWGVPVRDDRELFEHLVLDGFQAGLSWSLVLKRREHLRRAFAGFVPERLARFTPSQVARLLNDPGIIRNRLKVQAAVANARAYLDLMERRGSFSRFLWEFVGAKPKQNHWRTLRQLPAETKESRAMSRALKEQGFRFAGPTIVYAFMQAAGLVNDHIVSCFRHAEVAAMGET
ncbi:MAG: DNA-3-methyladenine glycosylase I [Gemmatimonadetes bacterium]|nr:DNA-3-methyladenine glycosylase I [Gemmatimonadota bacterium]